MSASAGAEPSAIGAPRRARAVQAAAAAPDTRTAQREGPCARRGGKPKTQQLRGLVVGVRCCARTSALRSRRRVSRAAAVLHGAGARAPVQTISYGASFTRAVSYTPIHSTWHVDSKRRSRWPSRFRVIRARFGGGTGGNASRCHACASRVRALVTRSRRDVVRCRRLLLLRVPRRRRALRRGRLRA